MANKKRTQNYVEMFWERNQVILSWFVGYQIFVLAMVVWFGVKSQEVLNSIICRSLDAKQLQTNLKWCWEGLETKLSRFDANFGACHG